MLRYFLATDDQVLGPLSDRMSLFFRRPGRVKMCYTRKFGKFRSSGNQKKKDAFVCFQFWGHQRVHWQSLRHTGTLGRLKKKRVRTDTKCRFTDRHRKEIGTSILQNIRRTNIDRLVAIPYQIPVVDCRSRTLVRTTYGAAPTYQYLV